MRALAVSLLVASALTCGCGEPVADVNVEGSWILQEAELPDGVWNIRRGGSYRLSVRSPGTDATSGCDPVSISSLTQNGSDISIRGLTVGNARGCFVPEPTDPLEGRFVTALEAVEWAERSSGTLTLRGDQVALTFERAP